MILSPPRIAAVLLALLMAGPVVFLGRYISSHSYVIPKTEPLETGDYNKAKKADKENLKKSFDVVKDMVWDEATTTHVVKAFPIKREPTVDSPKIEERVREIQEIPKKLVDRDEEPPHDVCQKDGGHKVKHGRYGWRCVYPHEHRHHHRRRH